MAEQCRILIADDEDGIRLVASRALRSAGFQTVEFSNGTDAYEAIISQKFDLLILDINMPGMDGFKIIEKVRQKGILTPIMIITGNDEEYNEVYGFSLGADNYIIKPFRPSALAARVKALLRRQNYDSSSAAQLSAGPFTFDKDAQTLYKNGIALDLTPKELALMQYFIENRGRVLSKEQIFEKIWKNKIVDDNTIMVSIRNLRRKIEDTPKTPAFLQTAYGLGYKFMIPEDKK